MAQLTAEKTELREMYLEAKDRAAQLEIDCDTQMREVKQRACAEQEKKSTKFTQLSEKFAKLTEKFAQVEAAKKSYHEKWKESEKQGKEMAKELVGLREKVDGLLKENADLRKERVSKERYLLDKLKRTEKELGRDGGVTRKPGMSDNEALISIGYGNPEPRPTGRSQGAQGGPNAPVPTTSTVNWDLEARDIIDQEWEQFRAMERNKSSV